MIDFEKEGVGYITSVATGMVGALPISNTVVSGVVSLACDVGAPAMEQGLNMLFGKQDEWDKLKYATDVASNLACDFMSHAVSRCVPEPQYIRDIKSEAQSQGIKGTNNLNNYLKRSQNIYFMSMQLSDMAISINVTMDKSIVTKVFSMF